MVNQGRDAPFGGVCSSVGRVPDCESGCREFDPHHTPYFCARRSMADHRIVNPGVGGSTPLGHAFLFRM